MTRIGMGSRVLAVAGSLLLWVGCGLAYPSMGTYFNRLGNISHGALVGQTAILSTEGLGLISFDISDPTNPVPVDTLALIYPILWHEVFSDTLVLVADDSRARRVVVSETGELTLLEPAWGIPSGESGYFFRDTGTIVSISYSTGGHPWDQQTWSTAYAEEWNGDHYLTVAASPTFHTGMYPDEEGYGRIACAAWNDPYFYVAVVGWEMPSKFIVYEASEGSLDSLGEVESEIERPFRFHRGLLFVEGTSDDNHEIYSFPDDPLTPVYLGTTSFYPESGVWDDGTRLVQPYQGGVGFFDSSDPTSIELETSFPGPYTSYSVTSSRLLIVYNNDVRLYTLDDEYQFEETWDFQNTTHLGNILAIPPYVFLYDQQLGGHRVLDATDPLYPVDTGLTEDVDLNSNGILQGNVWIETSGRFIKFRDVSDPFSPNLISMFQDEDHSQFLDYLYLIDTTHFACKTHDTELTSHSIVVDFSDPANPVEVYASEDRRYWTFSGWRAAGFISYDSLAIVDFRNLDHPDTLAKFRYDDVEDGPWSFAWPYFFYVDMVSEGPGFEEYYLRRYRFHAEGQCDTLGWNGEVDPYSTVFMRNGFMVLKQGNRYSVYNINNPHDPEQVGSFQADRFLFVPPAVYIVEPTYLEVLDAGTLLAVGEISQATPSLPTTISLAPPYPNPFNAGTMIRYSVPRGAQTQVRVYDLLGRQVRLLENGSSIAGARYVYWDGRSDSGSPVTSGVYMVRLETERQQAVRKVVLVK